MNAPPLPSVPALFLDIDGTLVELRDSPGQVAVDRELLSLLPALHRSCGGALALVSGRPVSGIDVLFSPLKLPAAGQHGVERRDAAGETHSHAVCGAQLDALRQRAAALAQRHPELLVEDKGASVALHFRAAPHLAGEVQACLEEWLAEAADFTLQEGKMVLEAKPAGRDKGTALLEFMAEPPFRGRQPVFLGDDVTDEYGFQAVNRLGGLAVKVGQGTSAAPWRLPDVAAVHAWLRRLAGLQG
jgi:trehalose 6-phosphate phosphatase